MADTGQRLWFVTFRDRPDLREPVPRFNILAGTPAEAEKKARLCLVDLGFPKTLLVRGVNDEGTIDEPAPRRKGARDGR